MRPVKFLLLLICSLSLSAAAPPAAPSAAEDPVYEISLLDLMSIEYNPGEKLPTWVRALNGHKVRVEGYMALGTPEGLEKFELVWDSCGCGQSIVNHFIEVTLTEETTAFNPDIIYVEGYFDAGEVLEDGYVVSLFRLKAPKIQI